MFVEPQEPNHANFFLFTWAAEFYPQISRGEGGDPAMGVTEIAHGWFPASPIIGAAKQHGSMPPMRAVLFRNQMRNHIINAIDIVLSNVLVYMDFRGTRENADDFRLRSA